MIKRPTAFQRRVKQAVGFWKFGKVGLNPASWSRNVISNFVLADMAGLAPYKVPTYGQAFRDLLTKGQYYREARDAGARFGRDTFSGVELASIGEFATDSAHLHGSLTWLGKRLKDVGRFYQAQEELFKLAVYIDHRKRGMLPKLAVKRADEALFDYRRVPEFVDNLRSYGFVPFVSFSYFALPRTAQTLAHRPAIVNRYGHLFRVFEDRKDPKRQAAEQQVLPPFMRDGHLRLPGTDDKGRAVYVDAKYWLPWSDIAGSMRVGGFAGEGGPKPWYASSPYADVFAAAVTGLDPFSMQPIEKLPGGWRGWIQNLLLPPLLGHGGREIIASAQGKPTNPLARRAEPRTLGQALAANLGGVRVRPVDFEEERIRRIEELAFDAQDVQREIRRYLRSKWLSQDEKQGALAEQMQRIRVIVEQVGRLRGLELGPKLADPVGGDPFEAALSVVRSAQGASAGAPAVPALPGPGRDVSRAVRPNAASSTLVARARLKFAGQDKTPMTRAELEAFLPELEQLAGRPVSYQEAVEDARTRGVTVVEQ